MRSRFTILGALMLLMALAVPQVGLTQAEGLEVTANNEHTKVVQYGNNQLMDGLRFTNVKAETDLDFVDGMTITVQFGGGLTISNPAGEANFTRDEGLFPQLSCGTGEAGEAEMCTDVRATAANNDDGVGTVTIILNGGVDKPDYKGTLKNWIAISNIRADVSKLAGGADINVVISTSTGQRKRVGGTAAGGIDGNISTVAAGLKYKADSARQLACGGEAQPTITLTEGYAGAWGGGDAAWRTRIRIELQNLPLDAKVTWPSGAADAASGDKIPIQDSDGKDLDTMFSDKDNKNEIALPLLVRTDQSSTGDVAIYEYRTDGYVAAKAVQFKITLKDNDFAKVAGDSSVGVSVSLWPEAARDSDGDKTDLATQLSYQHPLMSVDDNWLNVSECVTYLLYPFVTCGSTPEWTTGISVSNTTLDEVGGVSIFGAFDDVDPQSGPVTFYGFPKSVATVNGSGVVPGSVVSMLTSNLAAGDTYTFTCSDSVMAGMEGYAIIKAGFQQARGMGFVIGMFEGGSIVDVTHGYTAEVIEDPEMRDENPTN